MFDACLGGMLSINNIINSQTAVIILIKKNSLFVIPNNFRVKG